MIEESVGGGPFPDAISVCLPADPFDFDAKDVRLRRRSYRTLCGDWTKLPRTVKIKDCSEGTYLVAKPHPRYHGYCRKCAELAPMPMRTVMPA